MMSCTIDYEAGKFATYIYDGTKLKWTHALSKTPKDHWR